MPDDTADIDRLRAELSAQHVAMAAAAPRPGTDEYASLTNTVLSTTSQLLEAEDAHAQRVREQARAATARHICRVAEIALIALGLSGTAALGGWVTLWWLALIIPLLALVVGVRFIEAATPRAGQQRRRVGVYLLAVAAVGTAMIEIARWPGWSLLPVTAIAVGGVSAWLSGLSPALREPGGIA